MANQAATKIGPESKLESVTVKSVSRLLIAQGMTTLSDVAKKTELDLLRIRGVGRRTVKAILYVLEEAGLSLRPPDPLPPPKPRLRHELTRARALLKRIEWNGEVVGSAACPECVRLKPGEPSEGPDYPSGHSPDCELAALIGK